MFKSKKEQDKNTIDPNDPEGKIAKKKRWNYIRSMIAFFILGVTNNYGYVIMLSGAYDIINEIEKHEVIPNERNCTEMSTGVILLADIIPSFFVKLLFPFFPLYMYARVIFCVCLSTSGFLLVAFGTAKWIAISGVVITSLTSGLGELSFLQYSAFYDKNVICTWSSGTGAAGVLGAISYTLFSIISTRVAMLCSLVIPVLMTITFWVILPKPDPENIQEVLKIAMTETIYDLNWKQRFAKNIVLIPGLLKYMIPLSLVYLFEYFINQGMYELIYYENIFIDHAFQYKILQILYQINVFVSRSSVNFFRIKRIWILSLLQFFNVIFFTFEVIFYFVPTIWIIFILTLWEGLLGGAAYVNTYYRISSEVEEEHKLFSISMTTISDTLGITLAGLIAMPVHNAICFLDKPTRLTF